VPYIPTRFKEEVVRDLARYGLSPEADTIVRNVVACTGKQFCNIAVSETKSHALQLIEDLRKRALVLHGIRIHMSGCPSSCAGHHIADIGLKGVRVRRLLGTEEGFDVFLGGGIHRGVQLGLPYKAGVDVGQLPQLIEEVVQEYYLNHKPGQSFSDYWRECLEGATQAKVLEEDYRPPVWVCEKCEYHYRGEDPPVFCPSCSALRRHFARIEEKDGDPNLVEAGESLQVSSGKESEMPQIQEESPPEEGFRKVALAQAVSPGKGLKVILEDKEIALFRFQDRIFAIDNLCPHEGGSLADGEITNNIVTCPLHGWTFDVCRGCGIDPSDQKVSSYEVRVEGEDVWIKL